MLLKTAEATKTRFIVLSSVAASATNARHRLCQCMFGHLFFENNKYVLVSPISSPNWLTTCMRSKPASATTLASSLRSWFILAGFIRISTSTLWVPACSRRSRTNFSLVRPHDIGNRWIPDNVALSLERFRWKVDHFIHNLVPIKILNRKWVSGPRPWTTPMQAPRQPPSSGMLVKIKSASRCQYLYVLPVILGDFSLYAYQKTSFSFTLLCSIVTSHSNGSCGGQYKWAHLRMELMLVVVRLFTCIALYPTVSDHLSK
jgi:hypothetical protein